jgi:rifampicin phosphotransferase
VPPSGSLVVSLDEVPADPQRGRTLVGGKAAQLAGLRHQQLSVPPAFVITTSALRSVASDSGLTRALESAAAALASGDGDRASAAGERAATALRRAPLPDPLLAEVARHWRQLVCRPVGRADASERALFAVRSSAAAEDGSTHSHAGQFDSVLNISGLERVWLAVREVWASWFSDRAVRYRLHVQRESGGAPRAGPAVPAMAVLVQRMIVPRASGILFTAHPVTGSRREMTLEAGPGLGEALAQGRVHPDFFLIRRQPLRVAQRDIAPHVGQLDPVPPGSGELRFRAPEEGGRRRRRACISNREALAIARLGLSIEERTGCPIDLEWTIDRHGRLFVLQARPITALVEGRATTVQELRDRPVLWTQRFCGERWTDQATPLGWSVIQPLLHHFTAWEDASKSWLGGSEPSRRYRGRPYFNITIFRHLAYRLPGGTPPQLILEMFPPEEAQVLRTAPPYAPNLLLVGSIFRQVFAERRWERYRYNFLTNHKEWDAFRPEMERRTEALPIDFTDATEGLRAVDDAKSLMVEYLEIHLLSLLFAHLTYELLDKALRSWVGESGEALRSALVSVSENETLRVNRDLWTLAASSHATPGLAARLQQRAAIGWPAQPMEWLEAQPGGDLLLAGLQRFLDEHGHRSDASWEIFSNRWADSPEVVLSMIVGAIKSGDRADPDQHEHARAQEREHAEELVRSRLDRTRMRRALPWRRRVFDELLRLCRRYMALRENQRYAFDRLLLRLKRIFERTGALLDRDGLLAGEDIVFLQLDELRALAAGAISPQSAAEIVRDREMEFEANRSTSRPDFLIAGDQHLGEQAGLNESAGGRTLRGLGISPGTVRGTVKVVQTLADMAKLQPGDILVTRSTDPGWTPLFLTAAGLVLELGSLLSHGAVVAREYRLPAVVNIQGATRVLEDGMEVTIDGDQGRVIVHRAD